MSYSLTVTERQTRVFRFLHKRRDKEFADKEAEINAINEKVIKKAQQMAEETKRVNELARERPDDIASLIFYATGGYRRQR